jgi:hypothetical protein
MQKGWEQKQHGVKSSNLEMPLVGKRLMRRTRAHSGLILVIKTLQTRRRVFKRDVEFAGWFLYRQRVLIQLSEVLVSG